MTKRDKWLIVAASLACLMAGLAGWCLREAIYYAPRRECQRMMDAARTLEDSAYVLVRTVDGTHECADWLRADR